MTEKEKSEAKFLNEEVLPKLQEMQRDLYNDDHINMDVEMGTYKKSLCASFFVTDGKDSLIEGERLCVKAFYFSTYLSNARKSNEKTLRGISHFVKNWQQRLA